MVMKCNNHSQLLEILLYGKEINCGIVSVDKAISIITETRGRLTQEQSRACTTEA